MGGVVTAEAARIVGVAEIIGVGAPRDLEIREYVALVEGGQHRAGSVNFKTLLDGDFRIPLLVERAQTPRDLLGGFRLARVTGLEKLDRFFLDERQTGGDLAQSHGLVHGAVRRFESVRGAVVAIDTLNLESGERADGIGG